MEVGIKVVPRVFVLLQDEGSFFLHIFQYAYSYVCTFSVHVGRSNSLGGTYGKEKSQHNVQPKGFREKTL